jgi:hypothetical protein
MRILIRIRGAKPMRIHADPDLGQTSQAQKVEFSEKNTSKELK